MPYIVQVIKLKASCTYGATHLFTFVNLLHTQPKRIKKIVKPVIQRKEFFIKHENLLLSFFLDDDSENRNCAVEKIMNSVKVTSRKFEKPEVNFKTKKLRNLIKWPDTIFMSPILHHHHEFDIENTRMYVKQFPYHTQAVERHTRVVSQISEKVCGAKNHDGYI